jgi:hypothetical protein
MNSYLEYISARFVFKKIILGVDCGNEENAHFDVAFIMKLSPDHKFLEKITNIDFVKSY